MKLHDLFETDPPKITITPVQRERDKVAKVVENYFKISRTYSINDDLTIDVKGGCKLVLNLTYGHLPVKFNLVTGNFTCSSRYLTTLEGSPKIVKGSFDCGSNELKTLEDGPQFVSREYHCYNNKLTSLVGVPRKIGGQFSCHSNPLTSLDGIPDEINGYFVVSYMKDLPLLKLLFVKGVLSFQMTAFHSQYSPKDIDITQLQSLEEILNKYYGKGQKGAIQAAAEMTRIGFKGNARL